MFRRFGLSWFGFRLARLAGLRGVCKALLVFGISWFKFLSLNRALLRKGSWVSGAPGGWCCLPNRSADLITFKVQEGTYGLVELAEVVHAGWSKGFLLSCAPLETVEGALGNKFAAWFVQYMKSIFLKWKGKESWNSLFFCCMSAKQIKKLEMRNPT